MEKPLSYPLDALNTLIHDVNTGADASFDDCRIYRVAVLMVERFAIAQISWTLRNKQACQDFERWVSMAEMAADMSLHVTAGMRRPGRKELALKIGELAFELLDFEGRRHREATGRQTYEQKSRRELYGR